jgi:hypothetical protein
VERSVHDEPPMATLGQVISMLYAKYERQLNDEQMAAVATQVTLDEMLRSRRAKRKR